MVGEPQVLRPSFVGHVAVQGLASVEDRLVSLVEARSVPQSRQIEATYMVQAVVPDIVR